MMNIKIGIRTVCILFALFTVSCECEKEGIGIVVDSKTKLPVDSVLYNCYSINKVGRKRLEQKKYTDTLGIFGGTTGLVGAGCDKCQDLEIEFSKFGYKNTSVTNPVNDTILLEKE